MDLEALIETYQALQVTPPQGCTEAQIAQAEALRGSPFPAAYRAFLAWAGVDSGEIFLDVDESHYLRMLAFLDEARAMAAPPAFAESLPDDALIIQVSNAMSWAFIRASDGDDPPVYQVFQAPSPPTAVFAGPDGTIHRGTSIHRGPTDTPSTVIKGPPFTAWLADFIDSLGDA